MTRYKYTKVAGRKGCWRVWITLNKKEMAASGWVFWLKHAKAMRRQMELAIREIVKAERKP